MKNLINMLNKGVTQFHVVEECKRILSNAGFQELKDEQGWNIEKGGKYYISPFSSMLIAFAIGHEVKNLRIGAAHTDFPMLKLKSKPMMKKEGYTVINVEPYGGLISQTWFDRPLGLAGKVILKSEDLFKPEVRLFSSNEAVGIIPNLAPHLKKDDTTGKIDSQKELIPIISLAENDILKYVADSMSVNENDILDFDLYLYNMDEAAVIGLDKKLVSSPRIDNVSSVAALMDAITGEVSEDNLDVVALFDNEEIGSRSKQGADSVVLADTIENIFAKLGMDIDEKRKLMAGGFMLSLDVAHGIHPNYPEKSDPTNKIVLGRGVVLKTSASQRYVTDSEASGVIVGICDKCGIKFSKQVNKSGMPGGQTLGPIMSSYLPIKAVDMGIPVLAMHSARELGHADDYEELVKLLKFVF